MFPIQGVALVCGLDLRQYIPHGICCLFLRGCRDMGIGVQREARREVAQHPGDRLDIHSVLQRQRCKCVSDTVS